MALAVILLGVLRFAYAVDVNARIKGTVTDPQGGALAGIHVTAVNEATGLKLETVSQSDGNYLFAQVPVGSYTISVAANGFKTFTAKGIVLAIDQEYVEPIQLTVGSTSEVVEVQASAVQVNTSDMELSNVVNSEQIVELPLINRNFTGLELTLPGVQASSDRFGTYSVSGGQTQQSEFLINGADTNDIALNTLALSPNLDAIDQFNLIDGPLNAEYDRNSGGIVSATIKSGSNKFHGDAFEFYRDTFLNTNNYFQKTLALGSATPVSPYHQHIFGGTVGGPILHDKLFFFFAYQRTHQRVPDSNGSGSSDVFDAANLNGDFSAEDNGPASASRPTGSKAWGLWTGTPIPASIAITGCSQSGETWAQCAYDLGGVLPKSSFNSIASALATKFVPPPNNGTYGFIFKPVDVTTGNQYLGRIDVSPNASNQIYFVGIYDKAPTTQDLPFTGATLPGFGDVSTRTIQQYTADYVHQFNASMVNDFSAHYTRFNFDAVEPQNMIDPTTFGFAIHPQNKAAESIPTISVALNGAGGAGFTLGFSTNGPQPRIDQVAQLDDSVSKVWGNHTLKFGYDGRRFNVHNPFFAVNSGAFNFANTGTYSSGDGGVDFLMGVPATYSQNSGAEIIADAFLNYVYAQDTWKLTPTFTLSYGLGYSIDTPLHNNQYGGEGIVCIVKGEDSKVFPGAPTGWVYPGDPGCNNSGKATTRYSEFGPRVGFAWAPDLGALSGAPGKFSIRGGFGIYYDRSEEETALQTLATPPFGTSSPGVNGEPQFANPFNALNNDGTVPNPFPYTFPAKGATIDFGALEANNGGGLYNVSTYGSDFRAPYAENIQLSVEREFPSRIVARASYVGSLARHNQSTTDANPVTPAGHAACMAGAEYSPYLGFTIDCPSNANLESVFFPQNTYLGNPLIWDVGQVDSTASASYHSLQANVEKGTTHGLTLQLSYTYAHAIDSGSSFENAGFGEASTRGYNQFAPQLNVGDSNFDVRHRLVISPIYVTPMRHGSAWYSPINLALSGWEVAGITTLATGFPFDVSYAGGSSNSGWCPFYTNYYACPDAPNQVAPIVKLNPRAPRNARTGRSAYVAKTSWVNEPIGLFGNTHRDPGHGPGLNNTNMILAKNIYFSEDRARHIQLRMESDNVFNHTQFNNPGTTWNDSVLNNSKSTFGFISGAQASRLTQLAAKIYF
jgi:hypothetical protein